MTGTGRDSQSNVRAVPTVEELAAEVGPIAYGVAMRMLGDSAAAEDAVQDAFVQANKALPSFRGESSLRTWFLRILINRCKRQQRLWRRWLVGTEDVERRLDREEAPAAPPGDPALREKIQQAVLELPHRQRTAFVLRFMNELQINEIAEIMGCAPGTVKATLHKTVRKLRVRLNDDFDERNVP